MVIGCALLLVAVGMVAGLELSNTTHWFHKKTLVSSPDSPGRTLNSDTKGQGSQNTTNSDSPANQPSQVNKDNNSEPTTGGELKTPTGNFVSNHHPNLSGKPAPNEIQSVCVTTAGASCQITFTKDGVTKSLPAQTTDRGGAAYWTWKLQDIDLGAGSWKVQAKASLNGQNATADDALTLEVAQ